MPSSKKDAESERLWRDYLRDLVLQREDVERAAVRDEDLARFCLIFDTLALRGVEGNQAARTASLIFTGRVPPVGGNPPSDPTGPRCQAPGDRPHE
jgi:hypothetical protein